MTATATGSWRSLAGSALRSSGLRGRKRLATVLTRYPGRTEVRYTDRCGYERLAALGDQMEARVFLGLGGLPAVAVGCFGLGDWVIDVGANIGGTTGEMCRAVGPQGCVWALEPVPRNLDRLRQLQDANAISQLAVFPVAASRGPGTAMLSLAAEGFSGHASFHNSAIGAGTLEVPTAQHRRPGVLGAGGAAPPVREDRRRGPRDGGAGGSPGDARRASTARVLRGQRSDPA